MTTHPIDRSPARRGGRDRSRGLTLLEVMVVVALLAAAMSVVLGAMVTTQRQVTDSVVMQDATAQARRAADAIISELRNVNMHTLDIHADGIPFESSSFRYRVIDGWDDANDRPVLHPSRALIPTDNDYRRIWLEGTTIWRDRGPVLGRSELAQRVLPDDGTRKGLEITFDGAMLKVRVTVQRLDSRGNPFSCTAESEFLVRNFVLECS